MTKHLQPIDLVHRIRLGMNCLVSCLDPSQNHMPYWNCGFADGDVTQLHHSGVWDWTHDVARGLYALSMAAQATGDAVDPKILAHLADHQIALFDEADEFPGAPDEKTGKRTINLHNIRESIHALTALMKRGDQHAGSWASRMVRRLRSALDDDGAIHLDRLPPYVENYTSQPSMEGRAVDALVRYYRVTNDETALDLASVMTSYAIKHCFTPEGALREEAGTHGHSITALLAGMADLGLVTNDAKLLCRTRAIYDVGMPRFNSSFGWSMESLTQFNLRGESNNTGDLLRAALLLGKAGWPEYFEAAERILRSHLLPSQVVDVEGFSDDPRPTEDPFRRIASRIRGGFSFPTPNDYLVAPDAAIVTYDITSGAVDGMCEALWAAVTEDVAGVRVNLLLNREVEGIRVTSSLPQTGRLQIEKTKNGNLFVRLPSWVPRQDVQLSLNGASLPVMVINGYLVAPNCQAEITVNFPVPERRTVESIGYQQFTIDWRGDQIVAMSPPGQHLPMFPPC